jgi:hypothetical protein
MSEPTYAVYWNESGGPRYAGRIRLCPSFVELAGTAAGGRRSLARILFGELASTCYERGRLRLERRGGTQLEIGSVDSPGALREAADRLSAAIEVDDAGKHEDAEEALP